MKVVVAMDSFKASLSSEQSGQAIKRGILKVFEDAQVVVFPMADGGEGTATALVSSMGGQMHSAIVCGPLSGQKVEAKYGLIESDGLCIIEMAQASGLTLVSLKQRNPLFTTTYGVGELIAKAVHQGYRRFVIGIGGSATNDAGMGMLQALGYQFFDAKGNVLGQGGRVLSAVARISSDNVLPQLHECSFEVACDVDNPLYGPSGAAHVYGPQKGAIPEIVDVLDKGLVSFASVVKSQLGKDFAKLPGVGAAGGMGFGFVSFLNASLQSGVAIVLNATKIEEHIKEADLVITGEGRIDNQTVNGKAPMGVTQLANKYNKTVIGLAGMLGNDVLACNNVGMHAVFAIPRTPMSRQQALSLTNASNNIEATTEQLFRLIKRISQYRIDV